MVSICGPGEKEDNAEDEEEGEEDSDVDGDDNEDMLEIKDEFSDGDKSEQGQENVDEV